MAGAEHDGLGPPVRRDGIDGLLGQAPKRSDQGVVLSRLQVDDHGDDAEPCDRLGRPFGRRAVLNDFLEARLAARDVPAGGVPALGFGLSVAERRPGGPQEERRPGASGTAVGMTRRAVSKHGTMGEHRHPKGRP